MVDERGRFRELILTPSIVRTQLSDIIQSLGKSKTPGR
jgi:hypothetical protein